jgi:hypothetical protein
MIGRHVGQQKTWPQLRYLNRVPAEHQIDPDITGMPAGASQIGRVGSFQQGGQARLLEMPVTGERIANVFVFHHNERNAVGQRPAIPIHHLGRP